MKPETFLSPAEAASRLGVSAKALRLYEQRGLVEPLRSEAGWRAYGAAQMERLADVVALRRLGLSLLQISRVLAGDAATLEAALASHQRALELEVRDLAERVLRVREMRSELTVGRLPNPAELGRLAGTTPPAVVAFDLPWPWGGERFELSELRPITYLVGPLGSGKTQLAKRIAAELPGGLFLGLERTEAAGLDSPQIQHRVDVALAWLFDDGATDSVALRQLLAALESDAAAVVVDLVEQGLDQPTQEALVAHLRRRGPGAKPLLLMTRSSAILDLAELGADEAILFCPANHSPPTRVLPIPGAPGYESVAGCLATPEVRARTEGVIAMRPKVA